MMMSIRKSFFFAILLSLIGTLQAQETHKVHSHNDYDREYPFWEAYVGGAESIEADVILENDVLYVAHDKKDIRPQRTLESLYLNPLAEQQRNGTLRPLQLLIDIKTPAKPTLDRLVRTLKKYPGLLRSDLIRFVVSGNRPDAKDYTKYPEFILFDHQELDNLGSIPLQKVGLVSASFGKYSVWNGYGRMTAGDLKAIEAAMAKAKEVNKPFRFWATPDTKTAWARFAQMGVAYINTDHPGEAVGFLAKLDRNTYSQPALVPVYAPKYSFDTNSRPKNVILMIGDGNGLTQISSAMIANRGKLTMNQIQDVALVKTASYDDLITDSAAGGTAMATGHKTNNRSIGVDPEGRPLPSLLTVSYERGLLTIIATTDEINGATPSAFYAHTPERNDSDKIISDLAKAPIDLFIAGGKEYADRIRPAYEITETAGFNGFDRPKAIFLGEKGVPPMKDGRGSLFVDAVAKTLSVLESQDQPFFMMIEGAQIDNGGHANDTEQIITEMLDFDRTIAKVLEFVDRNPNTLVVITADHETSGFGIVGGSLESGTVEGDFLTVDHSGVMVPLFAYGPQAHKFGGSFENTEVFSKILEAMGFPVSQ